MKQNLLLYLLFIVYTSSLSSAIICKICEQNDKSCLFAENTSTQQCENDDDRCYKWFSRNGGHMRAQRGCISIASSAYTSIKTMIHSRDNGCIKRVRALDCFTFCSDDLCN